MNIKIVKFICLAAITMIVSFAFAGIAQAQSADNDLVVIFTPDPLFTEVNFLPNDSVFGSVEVGNNSGEQKPIAVEAINVVNDNVGSGEKFGDALNLIIKESSTELFNGTLTEFFDGGEFLLSNLNTGASTTYDFFINFEEAAENKYQGKNLGFDILIGFQGEDSSGNGNGGNSGNGGGSSGGGGFPSGLTITNESAVSSVNCTEAVISWQTSYFSTSKVIYGQSAGQFDFSIGPEKYGYSDYKEGDMSGQEKVTAHNVELTGLTPNTEYFYRCVSHASPATIGYEKSFMTCDPEKRGVDVLGEEGRPNLTIDKEVNFNFANPGDTVMYEVKITNIGNMAVYGLTLNDSLPDGLMFAGTDDTFKSWVVGDIEPGELTTTSYLVDVSQSAQPGVYTNLAVAVASNHDPVSASADLEVRDTEVLGVGGGELEPTGFSMKEFIVLVGLLMALAISAAILRKKYI